MSDATPVPSREEAAEAISSLWWILLVRGILLVVLGGYALFRPGMTAVTLTQIVGVFVILDGILAIVAALIGEAYSAGWTIVRGLIGIAIGIFVFGHAVTVAGITATVVLYVLAFGAIATGILEIVGAIRGRKKIEGERWLILGGALVVLFGVLLLMAPLAFGLLIVRIIGAYAILFGIALITLPFRARSFAQTMRRAG